MLTNEDYADYVLCISLLAYRGELRVPKAEAERIINEAYSVYCDIKHFQKVFVPIRCLDKFCPLERIPVPAELKNIPYIGPHK